MSQQDQIMVKNRELEAEIARYKETLAKMEKQWKAAVDAVNENKLQKEKEDLTAQVNALNKNIITLKKENQTLRLKAHMNEDESQLVDGPVSHEGATTSAVAMDRIKELEKLLKLKETELQDKTIESRTRISELELMNKTHEKNIEVANQKIQAQLEELKQIKKLQNADEATKLKAELKAAKERIPILEADLKKVTDSSKSENSRLIERCNRLQEELERSLNEDRQLKEKSGQLTVLNAQLTKKNVDLESEVAKLQKIKAELVIEKDQILRERLDLKIAEEKQKQDSRKYTELNADLSKQVEDLKRKLQATDPELLKEQRDMITDLKQKVAILERELQLVHDNFEKEIEKYKIEGGAGKKGTMDEATQNKLKQELVKARGELDQSTKQISGLQQELHSQQRFYEAELKKAQAQSKVVSMGSDREALDVANLQVRMRQLETKLMEALGERDNNIREISKLQEELKRQEEHYTKEVAHQIEHASALAKNSLLNDSKFVELMTKMNDEQRKYYRDKQEYQNNLQLTAEVARNKVKELEQELDKQQRFFDAQMERLEMECNMLKEFSSGYQKDVTMKEDQIQIMLDEVDRYKKEKKEAMSILKHRDIELQRANNKILELQKMNQDYQIMQSKLLVGGKGGDALKKLDSERSLAQILGNRENLNSSTLEPARHQGIKLPEINKGGATPARPSSQMRNGQLPAIVQSPAGSGGMGSAGNGASGPTSIKAQIIAQQQSKTGPAQPPMTVDQFFQKWNESGNNDGLKSELLDRLIAENQLKLEATRKKNDLLQLLHQAFENNTPIIYEKATIIVSDLVDSKLIQPTEIVALNAVKKVTRTLAPKKPTEDSNYGMGRQLSAMNLLCKLDKWDIAWTKEYSEEISKIAGVDTVIHFVEQSQHDNYRAQASQIVGMMAEEGSINHLLLDMDAINILTDAVMSKVVLVKRSAAEALAFLVRDDKVRATILNDRTLQVTLGELSKSSDQILTENLLLILMNLSLSKLFKPALYESGVLDSLVYNLVNGHTQEEQIYSIRIAFNLCYNSELKYKNYDILHPYLAQVLKQHKPEVLVQALLLLKRLTEGEKTKIDNDLKVLSTLSECISHQDKRVSELALKQVMIFGENNPKQILQEFEKKSQGIIHCIDSYIKADNPALQQSASQILILYCLDGFVGDINAKGRIEFLNTILKNFTAEDEKVRMQALKLMSLLLSDTAIHDIAFKISDFQFLVGDVEELSSYPTLYNEEQELLLYVIRIFGEFSRTPRISELNITNGIIPTCVRIMADEQKFLKETRIWALAVVNRGCQHILNDINTKIMQLALGYLSPTFLKFILGATDPEDIDFTMNSKGVFATLEQMAGARNTQVVQVFSANQDLVEKLLMGTKRTLNSTSDIGPNLRNLITNLRNASTECDRVVKEATKKLASRV